MESKNVMSKPTAISPNWSMKTVNNKKQNAKLAISALVYRSC